MQRTEDEINAISRHIVDVALKVHSILGPGLLESAYESCMLYELHKRGLEAIAQVELPIVYESVRIDAGYRIDLLVDNAVIVEIKACAALLPVHEAQIISYLKLSKIRLGLLINFHELHLKDGIKRFANGL
jgi:GxxExxY protein